MPDKGKKFDRNTGQIEQDINRTQLFAYLIGLWVREQSVE